VAVFPKAAPADGRPRCRQPDTQIKIDRDGNLSPCCSMDPKPEYGSVHSKEGWNSDLFVQVRRGLKVPGANVASTCAGCPFLYMDLYDVQLVTAAPTLAREHGDRETPVVQRAAERASTTRRPPPPRGGRLDLSVVIPLYENSDTVSALIEELEAVLPSLAPAHEVILVDDASPDDTLGRARDLARAKPWVKVVALARNVGQHAAITAGLAHASGRRVAIMDGDGQHPPEALRTLWARADAGADVVIATWTARTDGAIRRLGSVTFWRTMRFLLGTRVIANQLTLRLLSRPVVDALLAHGEQVRIVSILNAHAGFRQEAVEVEPRPRPVGRSSYRLVKLLRLFSEHVIASSQTPLYLVLGLGLLVLLVTLTFSFVVIVLTLVHGGLPGWPSTAVLISFLGGLTIAGVGVLGVYLGEALREAKRRPIFVIRELVGLRPSAYRGPPSLPAAPLLGPDFPSHAVLPRVHGSGSMTMAPHLDALSVRGYTILEAVISPQECDELAVSIDRAFEREVRDFGEARLRQLNEHGMVRMPFVHDERFLPLIDHPRVLDLVDAIVGPTAILHLQNAVITFPNDQHWQSRFHRDFAKDFVATRVLSLNAFWLIDPFDATTGATWVVPHTHRDPVMPTEEYLERYAVQIQAPRGSILFFDSMLIHRAGLNISAGRRRAINHQYTRPFIKQQMDVTRLMKGRVAQESRRAQLLGLWSVPPASLEEFRVDPELRTYRSGQG